MKYCFNLSSTSLETHFQLRPWCLQMEKLQLHLKILKQQAYFDHISNTHTIKEFMQKVFVDYNHSYNCSYSVLPFNQFRLNNFDLLNQRQQDSSEFLLFLQCLMCHSKLYLLWILQYRCILFPRMKNLFIKLILSQGLLAQI